jgi:hypothetical protein
MIVKHNIYDLLVAIDNKDNGGTEQVGLTVTLQIYCLEELCSKAETSAILTGNLWFFSVSSGKYYDT